VRKLIESDEVFPVFNALARRPRPRMQKYHNAKKVPQLLPRPGASKWTIEGSLDHGLPAELRSRRDLREIHFEDKAGRQVAIFYANEISARLRRRHQRKSSATRPPTYCCGRELRDHRALDRFPHASIEGQPAADVFVQYLDAEICSATIKKIAELEWKADAVMTDVSISIGA